MPIKILYIIDSLQYGGTEKQLVELIKNLPDDHFELHLWTLKESGSLIKELSIPTFCLNFKSFFGGQVLPQVRSLVKYVKRHQIDIIHTFFQDPFVLAALSRPFHQARLVGSFRDLGFWKTRAETLKMRVAYPFFFGFVANSRAVKEHFVTHDSISSEKIQVIYNGFDLTQMPPASDERSTPAESPLIGIVANCNRPVKRVDDFIRVAARVHRACPEARFMVVGDGHLRKKLEELSRSLSIEGRIDFVGNVSNPLDYISQFSLGVITSQTEGFCNAIVEYMACGIPVIATNVGGNSELVTEGRNGFLLPVGDVDGMADRALKLLQNRDLFMTMQGNNIRKIREDFSTEKMIRSYCDYYKNIVSE